LPLTLNVEAIIRS